MLTLVPIVVIDDDEQPISRQTKTEGMRSTSIQSVQARVDVFPTKNEVSVRLLVLRDIEGLT